MSAWTSALLQNARKKIKTPKTFLDSNLKVFVRVAANAAIPMGKLAPLVKAEPGHEMCHLAF